MPTRSSIENFKRRLIPEPLYGCLLWPGHRLKDGHGYLGFQGYYWVASRLAWFLENGDIPEGLHVLHACDNAPCCNPQHLYLGTDADNAKDRYAMGKQWERPRCLKGHLFCKKFPNCVSGNPRGRRIPDTITSKRHPEAK